MQKIDSDKFLNDLVQQPWDLISLELNPAAMWDAWKTLFMEIVDKHAPLETKRISKKHFPWITYDLMRKIYKGNYFKKSAIRDFKIHYGEALVRRMQPKETGPTTASPAKTRID